MGVPDINELQEFEATISVRPLTFTAIGSDRPT
jgi:hypothetical protein